jgi:hypothetical protein
MWWRYWQKTRERDMKEASSKRRSTETTAAAPSW